MKLSVKWLFFLYVLILLLLVTSAGPLLIPRLNKKHVEDIMQEKLNYIALESLAVTERIRDKVVPEDFKDRGAIFKRFPWLASKFRNFTYPNNLPMYAMILSKEGQIIFHSIPYFEGYYYNDPGQEGITIGEKPNIGEIPISYEGIFEDIISEVNIPIYSRGKVIGTMRVGISYNLLRRSTEKIREEFINYVLLRMLLLVSLVSVSGGILWYLFVRHIYIEKHTAEMGKMSTIGAIAAGLAHELRNPLNSMKFNIRTIRDRAFTCLDNRMDVDNDLLEMLDELNAEIDRLNGTLTDFLNYAKPSSTDPEMININDAIENILDFMEPECNVKNNINFNREFHALQMINLPLNGFKQCILNLILNAIDATPTNGGCIHIKTYHKKSSIYIDIVDQGMGMTKEISSKVFDVFFSSKENGTGMGLPIVKQFVDQIGGNIAFKSSVKRGTTFTLKFPINNHKKMGKK